MLNSEFSPWPSYSEEEIAAASEVLRSNRVNYWTGDAIKRFEQEFSVWVGCPKSIAVSNGTLALDLALKGLGIGPEHEVIVTPRTFIASISCVINAGAKPVFADVDLDSGNITPQSIEAVTTEKTRAIIPVHLAGWPCDMNGIMNFAGRNDLVVIEDCAQAHGATINGQSVGTFGDAGAWSFCQDKIMTTGGEGGMVTLKDDALWSSMWSFKDHGKSWSAVHDRSHPPGFRWVHESFGTNWRMLEMQAAIGLVQLKKMDEWSARRTAIAQRLSQTLKKFEQVVRVPRPSQSIKHAYYRLYAYVNDEGLKPGWDRDRLVSEISALGAPILHGTCSEVYLEKAFDGTGLRPQEPLPNARQLGKSSLMFLTHPTFTDEEVARICSAIENIFARAAR